MLLQTESFPHLLPGVDPLSEHDGAVGAVPQGLERHVPVHGPHVVTAGHQQELALITPPSDHWTFHMAGRVWSTYLTVTTRGYITDPEPTYKGSRDRLTPLHAGRANHWKAQAGGRHGDIRPGL